MAIRVVLYPSQHTWLVRDHGAFYKCLPNNCDIYSVFIIHRYHWCDMRCSSIVCTSNVWSKHIPEIVFNVMPNNGRPGKLYPSLNRTNAKNTTTTKKQWKMFSADWQMNFFYCDEYEKRRGHLIYFRLLTFKLSFRFFLLHWNDNTHLNWAHYQYQSIATTFNLFIEFISIVFFCLSIESNIQQWLAN